MKQEKRIPTIIGLILLIAGIFAGVLLLSQRTSFFSKASGACTPINPQVTNITNNSFDISFMTTDSCLGSLNIDGNIISDIRFVDSNETPIASKIHYFSVNNLKENTDYVYNPILNGTTYVKNEYQAKTAQQPNSSIPLSNLAWGRVFTSDLNPAVNSIVYLNIPGASPLSSFVTSNGNWNIPLATSFNAEKTDWFTPPSNTDEEIIVLAQDSPATQITSNTDRNNPVPDIIIGQNSFASLPVTGSDTTSDGVIAVSSTTTGKSLSITSPKEGETITTKKPDIFGNASSGAGVNLTLTPQNENGYSQANSDGVWHWSPTTELVPGDYIVTATAKNTGTGFVETVSRKFKVSTTASSLAFTASGSATIKPTVSPTSSPTVAPTTRPTTTTIPTISPTPTTTIIATATITSIPIPTTRPSSTPKPTKTITTSTSSAMPTAGSPLMTVILVSLAGIFMAVSFLL